MFSSPPPGSGVQSLPLRPSIKASRKRASCLSSAGFIGEGVGAFNGTCAIWREKVWRNLKNLFPQWPPPEPGKPAVWNQMQLTPPSGDFRNSITHQSQPLNGQVISTPIRGSLNAGRWPKEASRRLVEPIPVALCITTGEHEQGKSPAGFRPVGNETGVASAKHHRGRP